MIIWNPLTKNSTIDSEILSFYGYIEETHNLNNNINNIGKHTEEYVEDLVKIAEK